MKPSDRIREIFTQYKKNDPAMKEGTNNKLAVQSVCDFLDEFDMEIRHGNDSFKGTNIVELIREIERIKFDAENKCARILTIRMVSRFNAWVAEHGEDAMIKDLRVWMFGEDNK